MQVNNEMCSGSQSKRYIKTNKKATKTINNARNVRRVKEEIRGQIRRTSVSTEQNYSQTSFTIMNGETSKHEKNRSKKSLKALRNFSVEEKRKDPRDLHVC